MQQEYKTTLQHAFSFVLVQSYCQEQGKHMLGFVLASSRAHNN